MSHSGNPTALVTGASSGIGKEIALRFAAHGYNCILVARSEHKLQVIAQTIRSQFQVDAAVHPADLSKPGTPASLHQTLSAKGRQVDVLINNAGFGLHGRFDALSLEAQLQMINLNIRALTELTARFMDDFRHNPDGGVMNVGSLAGFQPGPHMAVYYASKAYVLHFSLALAEEFSEEPCTIMCLAPGMTNTGFLQKSGMNNTILTDFGTMSAFEVARLAVENFHNGSKLVVPGRLYSAASAATQVIPYSVTAKIVKWLHA